MNSEQVDARVQHLLFCNLRNKSVDWQRDQAELGLFFILLRTRLLFASILRENQEQGGKDTQSGWKPVYLTDRSDKGLPQKTPQKLRDFD